MKEKEKLEGEERKKKALEEFEQAQAEMEVSNQDVELDEHSSESNHQSQLGKGNFEENENNLPRMHWDHRPLQVLQYLDLAWKGRILLQ